MATIYTLGPSTRLIDEFLSLLAENGIALLTDVRRFPASRRHPQFSRQVLAESLRGAWNEYQGRGTLC